ncbi:hypothetical protein B0H11DRAFT_2334254 [Mycena galericulata]|nr:hypothetical protein B0H11DRAFT_2334254 [Mycena galericulata]
MPSSTALTLGPPGVEFECHFSRMRPTPMPSTLSVVVDRKATPKSDCEAMQSTIPISVSSEFSDYGHVSYSDVPMKKFYCWVYRNDNQELQRYRDRDIIEQEYELAARTLIALGRHLFSLIGREERERLQQNGLRTFLDVAYVVQEYAQDTADANTLGDGAPPVTPRIQAADRAWRLPVIHPHHNLINHLMVKKEEVRPLGMTRNKLAHPRPSRADFRSFADSLPLTLDLREALVQQQHWSPLVNRRQDGAFGARGGAKYVNHQYVAVLAERLASLQMDVSILREADLRESLSNRTLFLQFFQLEWGAEHEVFKDSERGAAAGALAPSFHRGGGASYFHAPQPLNLKLHPRG